MEPTVLCDSMNQAATFFLGLGAMPPGSPLAMPLMYQAINRVVHIGNVPMILSLASLKDGIRSLQCKNALFYIGPIHSHQNMHGASS